MGCTCPDTEIAARSGHTATCRSTRQHPATVNLLRWFEHDHLPADLQDVVRPLHIAAHGYAVSLPSGPELSAGLRKLLEAKDCMVRAAIDGADAG